MYLLVLVNHLRLQVIQPRNPKPTIPPCSLTAVQEDLVVWDPHLRVQVIQPQNPKPCPTVAQEDLVVWDPHLSWLEKSSSTLSSSQLSSHTWVSSSSSSPVQSARRVQD